MAVKKALGRPKRETAAKISEATKESKLETSEIKDQDNAKSDQSIDATTEANEQDLANQEKVSAPDNVSGEILDDYKDAEIKKLKAQLKEAKKTDKVVEVTTAAPEEVKLRPSQSKKQTHTVYVTKKRGDTWGNEQTREMSEQAYNAIAKDLSLRVTLPTNSRLVEPELKGCKDC